MAALSFVRVGRNVADTTTLAGHSRPLRNRHASGSRVLLYHHLWRGLLGLGLAAWLLGLAACSSSSAPATAPPSVSPFPTTHAARIDACITQQGNPGPLAGNTAAATATLGCATGRGLTATEKACATRVVQHSLSLSAYKRELSRCWT